MNFFNKFNKLTKRKIDYKKVLIGLGIVVLCITLIFINQNKSRAIFKFDGTGTTINSVVSGEVIKGQTDASGANFPELASNMIPVIYDEGNSTWVKADSLNKDLTWFNYTDKKWANAVTVTSTNRDTYLKASVGTPIAMSDINTMWVWIPRFSAIMIENQAGEYTEAHCSDSTITNVFACVIGGGGVWTDAGYYSPGAFNITFVDKETNAHDAFTFGSDSISGFWMGKFEITGSLSNVTILPNSASLVNKVVNGFFYESSMMDFSGNQYGFDRSVDTTLDTHMLKNNEWGAVAYLTQSIYGRCTSSTSCSEIGINNKSGYLTGYGAPAGSSSSVTNGTYETTLGMDASTTGNIYGVYDMSGGANEYVMGNYNNTVGESSLRLPNTKYYNVYTTSAAYTSAGLQHALMETSGWYGDIKIFVSSSNPWFIRGGDYSDSTDAGVFNFDYRTGTNNGNLGSRFSLIIN